MERSNSIKLESLIRIVAILSIGSFLICEIYDLDVWWHIAIGRDIISGLAVPTKEHFAAAALGRHYHDSHWLFQVLLAAAHEVAGMVGVELVMIGLWSVTLFYVYRSMSRWVSTSTSCIILFLAAMASSERFLPRPEIVTYMMTAIFYFRLQEGKYKTPSELSILFLLQMLWTNSHGLFVLGPFMAGCYWLIEAVRRLQKSLSDFVQLTILLAVLLLATLFTPYGIENWRYAFLLFTEVGPAAPKLLKSVQELSPIFGEAARSAPAFWFYAALLLLVLLTIAVLSFRRHFSYPRLLVIIGMFLASLSGRRNMALFAIAAAPFLAENLRYLVPERVKGSRIIAVFTAFAMISWAWYAVSGKYYLMMQIPARFGFGATPSFFPHALPDFLRKIKFKGQVLNSNAFGGFYLYHNYPKSLPLTDGRWEVYDPKVFDFLSQAYADPIVWERLISHYRIDGILLQHGADETKVMVQKLRKDPNWRLVYYDYAASFWIRSSLPGIPDAISFSADAALPPNPARIEDCHILYLFLRFMDAPELEIRNFQHALKFGQQTEMLLEKIGSLQVKVGRSKDAEKTFQELISGYPRNAVAINELAFIASSKGDLKKAEQLLKQGLESDPDNPDLKANYERVIKALNGFSGLK